MRIFVVGFILFFGYMLVYASAVKLSKDRVTEELVEAVRTQNIEVIEDRLDFRALRAFVKSDLKKKSNAVRSGNVAIRIGPEPDNIKDIVDFYIQPDRLPMVFGLHEAIFPDTDPADFVWDVTFTGPFSFGVTVGYPAEEGQQTLFSERMSTITFVFKAHGWVWRAKEMHIPLFMVPTRTYNDEEIEEFLSRTLP